MDKIVAFMIIILICLSAISSSRAEEYVTLEAATGIASTNLPFSSEWSGSVEENGLLAKEFAFRANYKFNTIFSISSTFGHLNYWYEENIGLISPFGGWPNGSGNRKALYFRPTLTLSSETGRLNLGILLYRNERGINPDENDYFPFEEDHRLKPVIGIELGDQGVYLYGRLLSSFPLISGGGIYEFGMGGRSKGLYEHKFFVSFSPIQGGVIGYRGEFRIYNQIAITPGFSIGGKNRDKIYMITLGIKAILDHSAKKAFN